jgi:Ca-activated chloride channel family protein
MSNSPNSPEIDPYAVLGVSPDVPFTEVRAVHRRLVRELHPDVNPGARARFDAVQAAFELLRALHAPNKSRLSDQMASASNMSSPAAPAREGAPPDQEPQNRRQAQPDTPQAGSQEARQPETYTRAPESRPAPAVEAPARVEPVPARTREEAPPPASAESPALTVTVVPGRDRLLVQPRAQMLYVLLDLQLSAEIGNSSQPLNLSLVLDHSSSMQRDDKLQRLKEAVARIIDLMNPRDYLSIVTFGDRATVLLPSSPLGNKRAAKEALDAIRCRGGTEISTGLRAGLQELQTHSANLISQMIVLTDGQTYGDEDICLALAAQAGERQVQITALGLGDDWNSALLDEIAARTGGQADYVQSAEQLSRVFEDQLRTLQLTALRNMQLTVNPDPSSRLLRATWVAPGIKMLPVPTETPPAATPVHLELGRVSTDRDYRLLLEFVIASRSAGAVKIADVVFSYDVPAMGRENETATSRIATSFVEHWDTEPPVNLRVHDALRKITAHRLQEQAMQAIQDGQTQKGTASLRTAAKHLEAAGSPELAKLALAEADRVERHGQAQAGNMKRIIYGTRSLG